MEKRAVPFAYKTSEHEQRIDPEDASPQTDYVCPECGDTVRKRSPEQAITHFFHLNAPGHCRFHKGESEQHYQAKQLIAEYINENGSDELVGIYGCEREQNERCEETITTTLIGNLTDLRAETEHSYSGYYIDVAVLSHSGEPQFFIEVKHKNAIPDEKKQALDASNAIWVECEAARPPKYDDNTINILRGHDGLLDEHCPTCRGFLAEQRKKRRERERQREKERRQHKDDLRDVYKIYRWHKKRNFKALKLPNFQFDCEAINVCDQHAPNPDLTTFQEDTVEFCVWGVDHVLRIDGVLDYHGKQRDTRFVLNAPNDTLQSDCLSKQINNKPINFALPGGALSKAEQSIRVLEINLAHSLRQCPSHYSLVPERICHECGDKMVTRKGPNGKAFLGCSSYPDCKNTNPIHCPSCFASTPMAWRDGSKGPFLGCYNYPECEATRTIDSPYTDYREDKQEHSPV